MEALTAEEVAARGHPVWAEVDLDAIVANTKAVADLCRPAELMGVVKGYAYGHGNPGAARAMLQGGATRIGVARVAEALHLREAGIEAPVHVFTEPPPEGAAAIVGAGLTATVYTQAFAVALSEAAQSAGSTVPVHVKIDTGMHRVGLLVDDVPGAMALLKALPGVEIEGAWSHLAVADVLDHPFTRKQLDLFNDVTNKIETAGVPLRYKHIANSAAALTIPDSRLDLVRCGIALYGLSPLPGSQLELVPALALRARVNMVKTVAEGESVSYGLRYELPRRGNVATVPAGYADGYSRALSGKADVLLRGRRYRLSGTVCMDQFMVDVGDDTIEVGDVVTMIGRDGDEEITAGELAELTGTIDYEVVSRIPSRVPRLFSGGDEVG